MSQDPINDRAATSVLQFGTRTLLVGTALCAVLVLVLHRGMLEVWCLQTLYRLAQACVFALMWRRERWSALRV